MRIVLADPCLRLSRPFSPHDLLLRAMADLDRSAIARGGSHVEELSGSDHSAALPYPLRIIPVFLVPAQ